MSEERVQATEIKIGEPNEKGLMAISVKGVNRSFWFALHKDEAAEVARQINKRILSGSKRNAE